MNIFYDHMIFQQIYGGISRYFRELIVRLLDREGVNVHLFMGLFLNRYGLDSVKGRYRGYWGLNVPVVRYTGRLRNFINKELWKFFQAKYAREAREGGRNCLYHPTYYDFRGLPRAKAALTVHDFTHERYSSLFPKDRTFEMKKKAFERADALICISESTKNDLLDLYGFRDSCKVKIIHHGYNDLSSLSNSDMSLPSTPYFLFVGPRHSYKNFDRLLNAFALSPDLRKDFRVVCFGGSVFSNKEKEQFDKLGIADKFMRYEGGDDILAVLYKNATALAFPSLYEGFGFPLLEAMSCGCPVVASDTSSIPEVVGDAALLFSPTSSEELAAQLCRVAYNSEIRKHVIQLGRERCALFSWDRCVEETFRFYEELF
ncbi:MAG: glycosyltransferase family 4 protein [Synergistaceae bacterium]|jgi:glycosyltransferase involved in cell wall biosynthesis|nr:glycosyltransferase family 4 protein [Synergistaceae bacterium]